MRTKDAAVLHQTPEMFLSVLLMDGVFDRHPGLRGAAVELGAAGCLKCVVGWTGYRGFMVGRTSPFDSSARRHNS